MVYKSWDPLGFVDRDEHMIRWLQELDDVIPLFISGLDFERREDETRQ